MKPHIANQLRATKITTITKKNQLTKQKNISTDLSTIHLHNQIMRLSIQVIEPKVHNDLVNSRSKKNMKIELPC